MTASAPSHVNALPQGAPSLMLPFTREEEEEDELARWRESCQGRIGKAVPVPPAVRAALARVLAPVDVALHQELLRVRSRERRG